MTTGLLGTHSLFHESVALIHAGAAPPKQHTQYDSFATPEHFLFNFSDNQT